MVESCIVMALLCLVLFGLLNISYVVSSRNVINYASVATARARTVGLNDFMLYKISHFTTIPTAGPAKTPATVRRMERPEGKSVGTQWSNAISDKNTPRSDRYSYEVGIRRAYYLSNHPYSLLDYGNWSPSGEGDVKFIVDYQDEKPEIRMLEVTVAQQLPLTLPFARVFFWNRSIMHVNQDGRDVKVPSKSISATASIEDHSRYYLKKD